MAGWGRPIRGRNWPQLDGKSERSITKSSSIKASMPDLTKHTRASIGEQTIGSSRILNEVFNRIGHPVRCSKHSSRRANLGLCCGSTVWTRAELSTCVMAGRSKAEHTDVVSSIKGDG